MNLEDLKHFQQMQHRRHSGILFTDWREAFRSFFSTHYTLTYSMKLDKNPQTSNVNLHLMAQ